ncbi:MAG: S46 family peptidase [Planctomycetota bacterium]
MRESSLFDPAERTRLFEGGQAAVEASDDPMIALVQALDPEARALRKTLEDQVQSVEDVAYAKLAAAKFAKEGDSVYPDATFTLRLSYGAVRGYHEGGAWIEPFTTMGGAYERERAMGAVEPFRLPESWHAAEAALDKSTPYNFVSTNDIIGGNSGSPVVDAAGEVVGLIFDGNVQSLVGAMAYSDQEARAVSVDSRAIVEALRTIYGADRVVAELLPERED